MRVLPCTPGRESCDKLRQLRYRFRGRHSDSGYALMPINELITEYALPTANSGPHDITVGPDGYLWFCEFNGNRIGRISPQDLAIVEFKLPHPNSGPRVMAVGPDGNIWFTENLGNRIGHISPDGGTIREFDNPTRDSAPRGIKAGPDGNLWFAESGGNRIGRITPTGVIVEFRLPHPNSNPRG